MAGIDKMSFIAFNVVKHAPIVDNSLVWKAILGRPDFIKFLKKMPAEKAYNYALNNRINQRVWGIILDIPGVRKCLN